MPSGPLVRALVADVRTCAPAAFLAFAILRPLGDAAAYEGRTVTVTDSIEMTRIIDPDVAFAQFHQVNFKFSPDGRRFAVVVRRGNLQTGLNEYSLVVFNVSSVADFVRGRADAAPAPHELARFDTASRRHGIQEMRWLPGTNKIAFIGRRADGIGQVYAVDAGDRTIVALTKHPTDIAMFDLSWQHNLLLYSAHENQDWEERNARGYVVGAELAANVFLRNSADASRNIRYFVADLARGTVSKVALDVGVIPRPMSISPDGKSALVLAQMPRLPCAWAEYEFISKYVERAKNVVGRELPTIEVEGTQYFADDTFGLPSHWMNRVFVIDLETKEAKALHDAPVVGMTLGATSAWTSDGSSVVLAGTYLPLEGQEPKERARRRTNQAVAEIRLDSGAIQRVTDLISIAPSGNPVFVTDWRIPKDGEIWVTQREYAGEEFPARRFVKQGKTWRSATANARSQIGSTAASEGIALRVVQDMNTSPEIVARDLASGVEKRITDLNPQFRSLWMGRVEEFEWTDRFGRTFVGGLVKPPDYDARRRYPVVIQTYGFRADEFLIDGPGSMMTAYAARPLAARGMIVLQIPEVDRNARSTGKSYNEAAENPLFLAALDGAIEALDAQKLIDTARIGLIGFSREGMHVHYAVTFSKYSLAAATIADSVAATPGCYTLAYGLSYPGMLEWEGERFIGAPFWGDGIQKWLDRSPLFHLDRVRTPLRIESHGVGMDCYWDTFAILKRHRKPVELIRFPTGSHRLEAPLERYTSQQGSVDWYAFWLMHEEDSDPGKAMQYQRWRALLADHLAGSVEETQRPAP